MGMCPMMGMMRSRGFGPASIYTAYPTVSRRKRRPKPRVGGSSNSLNGRGNQRLKIGQITAEADGTIVAEIVTVDGSLVQKLTFNRYSGFVRQER